MALLGRLIFFSVFYFTVLGAMQNGDGPCQNTWVGWFLSIFKTGKKAASEPKTRFYSEEIQRRPVSETSVFSSDFGSRKISSLATFSAPGSAQSCSSLEVCALEVPCPNIDDDSEVTCTENSEVKGKGGYEKIKRTRFAEEAILRNCMRRWLGCISRHPGLFCWKERMAFSAARKRLAASEDGQKK